MAHAGVPQTAMGTATAGVPKLLDRLREALRSRHYSGRTEQTYCNDGKGAKDRITMLPESLKTPLQDHLKKVKAIHEDAVINRWTGNQNSASYAGQSNYCWNSKGEEINANIHA